MLAGWTSRTLQNAISVCLWIVVLISFDTGNSIFAQGHLELINDQFVDGYFDSYDKDDVPAANDKIVWQVPSFDSPLVFGWDKVRSISLRPTPTDPQSIDSYIHLQDGQMIAGKIVSKDATTSRIISPSLGEISIPTPQIVQVVSIDNSIPAILETSDLKHRLDSFTKHKGWRTEEDAIVSTEADSILQGPLPFPDAWKMDIELSWSGSPRFDFQFAIPAKEGPQSRVPRIEVWNDKLVLSRESENSVEAFPIYQFRKQDSGIQLSICYDHQTGITEISSSTGKLLGRLAKHDDGHATNAKDSNQILLANYGSKLRIESLRITPWKTDSRESNPVLKPDFKKTLPTANVQVFAMDGSVLFGDSFEYKNKTLRLNLIEKQGTSLSLPVSQIKTIRSGISPSVNDTRENNGPSNRVSTISSNNKDARPFVPNFSMKGVMLSGKLAPLSKSTPAAMLQFKPDLADNSVGIRDTANGTIRFDQSMNYGTKPVQQRVQAFNGAVVFAQGFNDKQSDDDSTSNPTSEVSYRLSRGLLLRTGDIVDVTVDKIDESGIYFHSKSTAETFLPSSEVQSVQIRSRKRGVQIDTKKMERLLTVPRMRRDRPPTHLIVTVEGDFIRGNLISLEKNTLTMEEGLNRVSIPRSTVSVVIWLHDRNWKSPNAKLDPPEIPTNNGQTSSALDNNKSISDTPSDNPKPFKVYLRLRPTGRASMIPTRLEGDTLYGLNELLGEMSFPLKSIDRIAFGSETTFESIGDQPSPWKLSLAKLPSVFEDAANGGQNEASKMGTSSELVGKLAPNFRLKKLDGNDWELHQNKGKILVLDFWASWCGPCIQAMPVVDSMIAESYAEHCSWIGVNIQESKDRIDTILERLKIKGLVVLDQDGGVSSEYGAEAIPMVVVIDSSGIVRHVFVGGGDEELSNLKAAIERLLPKIGEK